MNMKNISLSQIKMFLVFALCGCTYSINMVHTEGTADDVVDETQTPTSNLKATIPVG
jgi:hypothetical protein